MRRGVGLLGFVLLALLGLQGAAAADEPPGLVVTTDSDGHDVVSVAVADDGSFKGSITVTNTAASAYRVSAEGVTVEPSTCAMAVAPGEVPAHRTVTLSVSSKNCKLGDESTVHLTFESTTSGGSGGDLTLPLAVEKKSEGVSVGGLLPPFLTAAILAALLVTLLKVVGYRDQRIQSVDAAGLPRWKPGPEPQGPETEGVTLTTPVAGLPSGWTFKDSWASNLSVGATVFVALFGSKDVLDAIFGKTPEGTTARLLIAGAIAALFVGLAPLVLKTIGKSTVPTVGGLLAAAFFTLVGVIGQILATAWIFTTDSPVAGPGVLPTYIFDKDNIVTSVLTAALIGFLLFYGYWTIHVLLAEAFPAPGKKAPTPVPNELLYAAAIAGSPGWEHSSIGDRLKAAKEAARAAAEEAAAKAGEAAADGSSTPEQTQLIMDLAELSVTSGPSRRLYSGIL